ncbi:hypothetical protein [Deinococcus roseus]|uniref:DUF3887 domain-containing protein n=1 Tax=Deinococcus roseus TaxID=392414 RepID=A0ABQ2D3B6_9DEIO|nr:hypothetical protein [Deinococcus roseus]GGJ44328.1 hypothetical protein GCM10008938_33200 [Deinococcus roseus]
MKKLSILTLTVLLTACSIHMPGSSKTKDQPATVKAQILDFYHDADALAVKLEAATTAASMGVMKQSLDDLPDGLKSQLLEIRSQTVQQHPEVQESRVWLSEKIQLVSEDQATEVTESVLGLFTLSTVSEVDGHQAWLAQIVLDMEKMQVVDYRINSDLSQPFTPAFMLVAPKLNEPPLLRRVWDGSISQ